MLDPILAAGRWRIAYNAAYDIYRHDAGYRVLASKGAHAATFALASAVMGDETDVFDSMNASTMSGTPQQARVRRCGSHRRGH